MPVIIIVITGYNPVLPFLSQLSRPCSHIGYANHITSPRSFPAAAAFGEKGRGGEEGFYGFFFGRRFGLLGRDWNLLVRGEGR